jgi:flagellar basal-body rod protein FlgC
MDTALNSVISSINAHGRKLGISANNVANVDTNGFKRDQAVLQEGPAGDVRVNIRKDTTRAADDPLAPDAPGVEKERSNVDLAFEMTSLVPTTIGYKVNLQVIRARDEMLGNLLDTLA